MKALEKLRAWIATYPGYNILEKFRVDYIDYIPAVGVFPGGLTEISRTSDIIGNTTVENQYNFGLYFVFEKAPGDDAGATINADWVMGFQEWIQAQSITGAAPAFGDDPKRELITAQNGVLYDATDEGMGTYLVQLSVRFKKKYEVI